MTARITLLPAAAAEQDKRHREIARNLGLARSGYEVCAALIAQLGNGAAPAWLDRFAQEEFGGTWDEVRATFAQVIARGEARL
jgi:hypothetical protein